MPAYGGFAPYPRRYGGGRPRAQAITDGLGAARGTAYTTDKKSVVYVENFAAARAIAAAWGTNQRLANQWDPTRMTSCLARWEAILLLPPAPTDTDAARRRRVGEHIEQFGVAALYTTLFNALTESLGPVFVSLEFIGITIANVHVPDGSYPWGTVAPGFPWYSTIARILVRTQKPSNYSEADFWNAVTTVTQILDPIVPAWVTFDWYRSPTVGTPIDVTDGPHGAGFYLDEPNLDLEIFDV